MRGLTTSELREAVLFILGLVWGAIFLSPENIFAAPDGVSTLFIFASDTVWGLLLIGVSIPALFLHHYRYREFRKVAHAFYWVFWMGMTTLALYRSSLNGIQSLDFLFPSVFFALALQHAITYLGLWRKI